MNILIVTGTLSGHGGIETCIKTVYQESKVKSDHVHIFSLCPSTKDNRWQSGISYSEITKNSASLKWQVFKAIPYLVVELRSRKPDVVVVIYSSTIPVVKIAMLLANYFVPIVSWLHFTTRLTQRLDLLKFANGNICISSEIADSVKKLKGINSNNVHLVFNGVSTSRINTIQRSITGPIKLLYIGRLMVGAQKRTDDLLHALKTVTGDWMLDVIGDGNDTEELKKIALNCSINNKITWHGWQTNPWEMIKAADVLILTSEFEGFPMVLIEAIARGIPCISSNCSSGPADIIEDEMNGWLYPVGEIQELKAKIQFIVDARSHLPEIDIVKDSAKKFDSAIMYTKFRTVLEQAINT